MASKTQGALLREFQAISPKAENSLSGLAASGAAMASAIERAAGHITQLNSGSGTRQQEQSQGGTIASTVSKTFTSGLGLVPLIGGLLGLFGGGGPPEPPPLIKYSLPESISFEAADMSSGIQQADSDQFGTPRLFSSTPVAGNAGLSTTAANAGAPRAGPPAPQINVNVQAMDLRSFLDHSNEIAQAVRQAMLHLNSINDVMSDL